MGRVLLPEEVDALLRLKPGRARRMALRGQIPAIVLDDGTVRFDRDAIEKLTRISFPENEAPNYGYMTRT